MYRMRRIHVPVIALLAAVSLLLLGLVSAAMADDDRDIALWRQEQPIVEKLEANGVRPVYDFQLVEGWGIGYMEPPGDSEAQRKFSPYVHSRVIGAQFDQWNPLGPLFREIATLPAFYYLHLEGVTLTEEDIQMLVKIPNLRWLRLVNVSISPEGVQQLAESKTLDTLGLIRIKGGLTDEHLRSLDEIESLRTLYLVDAQFASNFKLKPSRVTNEGLAVLGQMPKLTRLVLILPEITDEGFQIVERLQQLETLEIIGVDITNRSLAVIGKLRNLRHLTLSRNQNLDSFSDRGFQSLENLTDLEEVLLLNVNAGDQTMKVLGQLTKLKLIRLHDHHATNEGLSHLANLHALEFLYLSSYEPKYDREGLDFLGGLKSLQTVHVDLFDEQLPQKMDSLGYQQDPEIRSEFHRKRK